MEGYYESMKDAPHYLCWVVWCSLHRLILNKYSHSKSHGITVRLGTGSRYALISVAHRSMPFDLHMHT